MNSEDRVKQQIFVHCYKEEMEFDSSMSITDNSNTNIVSCILPDITKAQFDKESFQCSLCKKCFTDQGSLELHLRIQHREELHQCTICDSCFYQKDDLVRHQDTHTGENPFICSECGKCFALKGDLMNHMMSHTGEKLVQCSYCEIWFIQEGNLEKQQTIHTVEKPHQIIMCDKCLSKNYTPLGKQKTTEKKYNRYSLEEKEKIADLAEKYKNEYEKEVAENKKLPKHWDPKRKIYREQSVKGGYIARAIRELYPSLAKINNEHPDFRRALGVARRALETREIKRKSGEAIGTGSKYKSREPGAGRKTKAVEVRQAAFDWFVDIRGSLKGSLPIKIFKEKCEELYELWVASQSKEIKAEAKLKFSNHWVRQWMKEYNVSFSSPNKRFSISHEDRVSRITEFLRNVLRVRYYFQVHFKKEPVIISGDQMPLLRNVTSIENTMNQKKMDVYLKENHTLSRERATVYTQLSTEPQNTMETPEILFKGKDAGIQINPHLNMSFQYSPKGSYRLENMLNTVKSLKNRHHIYSEKDYALYILDDYSVHMQDRIRKYLLQQGYVLVVIGGGITGDLQINETHLHHELNAKYQEKESELIFQKLRANPNSVPVPSRDEMMQMLLESWRIVNIDTVTALKNNFILNAFDGSEDYLVFNNLMELVGEEIKAFRKELLSSPPPQSIDELIRTITPPQSTKIKRKTENNVPPDEGRELIDCEGEEIPVGEGDLINEDEVEELVQLSNHAPEALHTTPTDTNKYGLTTNTLDSMNKADSAFLKDFADVLHKHNGKTSKNIFPYYCKFQDILTKASCSLNKNILLNSSQSKELTSDVHGDKPLSYMSEQQTVYDDTLLNLFSQNGQLS